MNSTAHGPVFSYLESNSLFAQPRVNVSSSNKLSPFLFCKMSSTSYVVKEDLITKDELLEAIKRVETGPLPVHHTPCIEVINQSKG